MSSASRAMSDITQKHLDCFHDGLMSMVPVGAFVPWVEVVQISARFGWTSDQLFAAAESWQSLGSAEMDPRNATYECPPCRVRLLRRPDIDPEMGLLLVSSDEEPLPLQRRWKKGLLTAPPGSDLDIPLPDDLDLREAELIPTFFRLYEQHKSEGGGSYSGIAVDIPPWAVELFQNGIDWELETVVSLTEDILRQKAALGGTVPESDPITEVPDVSSSAQVKIPRPTKWGRCGLSHCCRAFRPVLGVRGPFLACGRRECRNTRDLTAEAPVSQKKHLKS